VGRCWEGGGAPPFWPWRQMIRALAEDLDQQTLTAWLGTGAAQVAQLVPGLAERVGTITTPTVPAPESDAARFSLFEAVAGLFRRAASAQPMLLILDDLHAADEPSVVLLQFLARELRGARLLVVATCREVVAIRPVGIGRRWGSWCARGSCSTFGAGPRGREGPHRDALGCAGLPGQGCGRPRADRGQPAVRP
jgi:hypothetical protein